MRGRLDSFHPALILTLHTFGEYLDFHPHLHALIADGLFTRDLSACGHAQAGGAFHPLPELPLKPLEELFRAHVLKLLVHLKLLPPERVQVLLSWKHSGFNVHHGDPVPPEHKAELEKLAPWNSLRSCRSSCSVYSTGRAQYILRNPFSVEKMTLESPTDTVIYRSRLNPKINRNFEVFTPHRLPGRHHPAHSGQRRANGSLLRLVFKQDARPAPPRRGFSLSSREERAGERRPGCTPPPPAKLPSKKWRDLILQVWHTDPLICPHCQKPMRVIAVIDQRQVVEKILRHLHLWSGTPPLAPARAPPGTAAGPWTREPFDDVNPMPDYENVLTD